jgi:threonylcarbamoyladenosine tRNA methylthiotransferase MtaB
MPGQLSADEKKERARQLIELDTVQSKEYRRSFKGKEVWVLWEEAKEISGQWYMIGHTKEYIRVALPISDLHEEKKWSGQIVQGTPGEMLTEEIMILNHCNFC